MKNLIKITDEETALVLAERGFSYVKEKFNKDTEVFAFLATPELLAELKQAFGLSDIIEEDTLRF